MSNTPIAATGYVSVKRYAELTGLTESAIRKRCQRGQIPVAPRDGPRSPFMINNALLTSQALSARY